MAQKYVFRNFSKVINTPQLFFSGPSTEQTACMLTPCAYPRNSCCNSLKAVAANGAIICGPQPPAPTYPAPTCTVNAVAVIATTPSTSCCPTWTTWGSWSACNDTCGSCGQSTRTRTCTTAASGCACPGAASQSQNCNLTPCAYPRDSCCQGMAAGVYNGVIICGPQVRKYVCRKKNFRKF